jgi:uncharacterized protein YdhG (YjbR/CyaY superfamily)
MSTVGVPVKWQHGAATLAFVLAVRDTVVRQLVRPGALVAAYFDTLSEQQLICARSLQQVVLATAPEIEQAVKWGNLTFLAGGRNLLALALHKSHAHMQVFNGAQLALQFPELDGVGKGQRHLKLKYGQPVDAELVRDIVLASLAVQG